MPDTPAGLDVRLAQSDDRDFVVALATDSFAALGDYRTTIEAWLGAPDVAGIVAVADGVRRGFALVALRRSIGFVRRARAELLAIAVEPDARRRGIARVLLARAEDTASRLEADEIRLHTAESNVAALSLFSAAGYAPCGRGSTSYPNGQRALALSRRLGRA